MHQSEHEAWNASHYPGTRQLCFKCEAPTGRCEDDSLWIEDDGPYCEDCYRATYDEATAQPGTSPTTQERKDG